MRTERPYPVVLSAPTRSSGTQAPLRARSRRPARNVQREGAWRVRLRRPGAASGGPAGSASSGASAARDRRTAERAAERANPERDRHADRPGRIGHHGPESTARSDARGVATSPAVGIYRPRTDLTVGDRVRTGDRLGAVDMLGVAQEVLAPMDGIVGASLSESGDAVEYGQELLVIEGVAPSGAATSGTGT